MSVDTDFESFRDDFVLYLASRLGVSKEIALSYLGDWLIAFQAEPHPALVARALAEDRAEASRRLLICSPR
jgi:hypothetical protein